jgi:hypothetical protein
MNIRICNSERREERECEKKKKKKRKKKSVVPNASLLHLI